MPDASFFSMPDNEGETTSSPRSRPEHGTRRWWLVGIAVLVVTGLALAAWLFLAPVSARKPAPPRADPPLTGAEANALATRLTAQNPADVGAALAAPIRQAFRSAPTPLVPSGDSLTIDPSTYQAGRAPGYGTVRAKASGPRPGTFLVFLVREEGSWHVLGTAEQ